MYPAPFDVQLSANDKYNLVQPDVTVVCDRDKLSNGKRCIGAPDWVIEVVSPSTENNDYIRKLMKYSMAGVREYWIIDPKNDRIVVYNLEMGLQAGAFDPPKTLKEKVKVNIYPELEIDNIIGNNEMNISDVYKELTSKIIGQDEQIKQILSTIWKQYNNEDKTFNYNMLINGPEGVGKTTIFKLLEELLGIPCVIINAKRLGSEGYIENILLNLLEKTEFDVERAKTGILVIDKLEEISTNSKERHSTSSKALQEIIINLIDEGVFTINTIDNEKYRFSMDKLLIIGIGNFNNNENLRNTTVGFNTALEDNTLDAYGIIPELANKFPILILLRILL